MDCGNRAGDLRSYVWVCKGWQVLTQRPLDIGAALMHARRVGRTSGTVAAICSNPDWSTQNRVSCQRASWRGTDCGNRAGTLLEDHSGLAQAWLLLSIQFQLGSSISVCHPCLLHGLEQIAATVQALYLNNLLLIVPGTVADIHSLRCSL